MVGRADKGLIISTGTFTREARAEAQRDGAPPLDLIDGDELVQKLKELRLGIKVTEKLIEDVQVDKAWFLALSRKRSRSRESKKARVPASMR
jgi:restriction system protein